MSQIVGAASSVHGCRSAYVFTTTTPPPRRQRSSLHACSPIGHVFVASHATGSVAPMLARPRPCHTPTRTRTRKPTSAHSVAAVGDVSIRGKLAALRALPALLPPVARPLQPPDRPPPARRPRSAHPPLTARGGDCTPERTEPERGRERERETTQSHSQDKPASMDTDMRKAQACRCTASHQPARYTLRPAAVMEARARRRARRCARAAREGWQGEYQAVHTSAHTHTHTHTRALTSSSAAAAAARRPADR